MSISASRSPAAAAATASAAEALSRAASVLACTQRRHAEQASQLKRCMEKEEQAPANKEDPTNGHGNEGSKQTDPSAVTKSDFLSVPHAEERDVSGEPQPIMMESMSANTIANHLNSSHAHTTHPHQQLGGHGNTTGVGSPPSPQIEGVPRMRRQGNNVTGRHQAVPSSDSSGSSGATSPDSGSPTIPKRRVGRSKSVDVGFTRLHLQSGSGDSADELLSESELGDGDDGDVDPGAVGLDGCKSKSPSRSRLKSRDGGRPHRVLAVHSDCRPVRFNDGRSSLKSFKAFQFVCEAQKLQQRMKAEEEAAAEGDVDNDNELTMSVNDLSLRGSLHYRHACKTPTRLPLLQHATARKLKQQKHHRRNSSIKVDAEGHTYQRAHPLSQPLHPIEASQLRALILRKKGRGVVLHKSREISRTIYDDVCRMLRRANAQVSEREEDLKLAGQIGQAILADNSKLETMVGELSTNLQEQLEAKEAAEAEVNQLKIKLDELTKLNQQLIDTQKQYEVERERLLAQQRHHEQQHALSSPTTQQQEKKAMAQSEIIAAQERLIWQLRDFLRNESLESQSLSENGTQSSQAEGEKQMASPPNYQSPPYGQRFSSVHSTASPSTSVTLAQTLCVELQQLSRKLRKERRIQVLERQNWTSMLEGMERELHATRKKMHETEQEVALVGTLRNEIRALQLQVDEVRAADEERIIQQGVEMRQKLQQARKHMDAATEEFEKQIQHQREENEQLRASKQELTGRIEELEKQHSEAESSWRSKSHALQLSLDTAHNDLTAARASNVQLSKLTAQLRDELQQSVGDTDAQLMSLERSNNELQSANFNLRALLLQVKVELERVEADAQINQQTHMEQLATLKDAFDKKIESMKKEHEKKVKEVEQQVRKEMEIELEKEIEKCQERLRIISLQQQKQLAEVERRAQMLEEQQLLEHEEIALRCIELSPSSGYTACTLLSPSRDGKSEPYLAESDQDMLNVCLQNLAKCPNDDMKALHRDSGSADSFGSPSDQPGITPCTSPSTSILSPHKYAVSPRIEIMPPTKADESTCTSPLPLLSDMQCQTSPRSMGEVMGSAHHELVQISIIVHVDAITEHVSLQSPSLLPPRPSPSSRAKLMESPLHAAGALVPHASSAAFKAADGSTATRASPTRAPLSFHQTLQGHITGRRENAAQHRLALLSSVGRALSIVTGSTPLHAELGNSPPRSAGHTITTPNKNPAPGIAAALATAMSPPRKFSAINTGDKVNSSIYVLPTPPFAVSPSDQLQLAYLYRYMYAAWVQAFDWLDSNQTAKQALWIEDRIAGHCFSCQKHWTVVQRRHHWSEKERTR